MLVLTFYLLFCFFFFFFFFSQGQTTEFQGLMKYFCIVKTGRNKCCRSVFVYLISMLCGAKEDLTEGEW